MKIKRRKKKKKTIKEKVFQIGQSSKERKKGAYQPLITQTLSLSFYTSVTRPDNKQTNELLTKKEQQKNCLFSLNL
jgi:uncharacterized protein with gpF-like domain